MSNDPKDTVVDVSKLMQDQPQTLATPMSSIPVDSIASMLTSCNEGAGLGLVGHEHFTYNGESDQAKND